MSDQDQSSTLPVLLQEIAALRPPLNDVGQDYATGEDLQYADEGDLHVELAELQAVLGLFRLQSLMGDAPARHFRNPALICRLDFVQQELSRRRRSGWRGA